MRKTLIDWDAVQRYYDEGHGFRKCADRFGFCHAAWIKAIERKALSIDPSRSAGHRRRYDWAAVRAFYDDAHTYMETKVQFGFCAATWDKAKKSGRIKARPLKMSIEELLASKTRSRRHIKARLFGLAPVSWTP